MTNPRTAGRSVPSAAIWGGTVLVIGVLAGLFGGADLAEGRGAAKPAQALPTRPDPAAGAKAPEAQILIRHGITEAPARVPGSIRIATYNVENFFDSTAPPNRDEPSSSPTEPKPESHRKAVAAAIRAVDADIIALEEVESKAVITKFRDEYLKGMGYDYIASIDSGDPRGIEQSVLSRFPLSDETVWLHMDLGGVHPAQLGNRSNPDAGRPMVFKRSPLGVTVTVPRPPRAAGEPGEQGGKAVELGLIAVHHKSGAYHGYLREAESKAVLRLASTWEHDHPGANVVIVGDFNARPSEAAFKTYLSAGYSDVFAGLVGGRPADAAAGAGKGERVRDRDDPKHITHASGRTIDHILLAPAAAKAFEVRNAFVLGTPQRPADADWRSTPPPDGYGSDHYPVVVDLVLVSH